MLGDAFYRPTRLKKAGRTGTSFEGIQLIFMDQTIAALGFFKKCKDNYENKSGCMYICGDQIGKLNKIENAKEVFFLITQH